MHTLAYFVLFVGATKFRWGCLGLKLLSTIVTQQSSHLATTKIIITTQQVLPDHKSSNSFRKDIPPSSKDKIFPLPPPQSHVHGRAMTGVLLASFPGLPSLIPRLCGSPGNEASMIKLEVHDDIIFLPLQQNSCHLIKREVSYRALTPHAFFHQRNN